MLRAWSLVDQGGQWFTKVKEQQQGRLKKSHCDQTIYRLNPPESSLKSTKLIVTHSSTSRTPQHTETLSRNILLVQIWMFLKWGTDVKYKGSPTIIVPRRYRMSNNEQTNTQPPTLLLSGLSISTVKTTHLSFDQRAYTEVQLSHSRNLVFMWDLKEDSHKPSFVTLFANQKGLNSFKWLISSKPKSRNDLFRFVMLQLTHTFFT